MAGLTFVGIGPGAQVFSRVAGSPASKGSSREEALNLARTLVSVSEGERLDFINRWIDRTEEEIENEKLDGRVERITAPYAKAFDKTGDFGRLVKSEAEKLLRARLKRSG